MITPDEVEKLVLEVLENVNDELPAGRKVNVRPDTVLFGANAELDSLSLVSFVVDVETAVNARLGIDVSLADDRAMSRDVLPFTNVQTLKAYIMEIVSET